MCICMHHRYDLSTVAGAEVMVAKNTFCTNLSNAHTYTWSEYGPTQVMDLNVHGNKFLWIVNVLFGIHPSVTIMHYIRICTKTGAVVSSTESCAELQPNRAMTLFHAFLCNTCVILLA